MGTSTATVEPACETSPAQDPGCSAEGHSPSESHVGHDCLPSISLIFISLLMGLLQPRIVAAVIKWWMDYGWESAESERTTSHLPWPKVRGSECMTSYIQHTLRYNVQRNTPMVILSPDPCSCSCGWRVAQHSYAQQSGISSSGNASHLFFFTFSHGAGISFLSLSLYHGAIQLRHLALCALNTLYVTF